MVHLYNYMCLKISALGLSLWVVIVLFSKMFTDHYHGLSCSLWEKYGGLRQEHFVQCSVRQHHSAQFQSTLWWHLAQLSPGFPQCPFLTSLSRPCLHQGIPSATGLIWFKQGALPLIETLGMKSLLSQTARAPSTESSAGIALGLILPSSTLGAVTFNCCWRELGA